MNQASVFQETERLKEIELKMLDAFVYVCDKLNLQYFLIGGTLLGAVRHRGFIPWDDDIDVGMLRSDYEIFIKNAPQYLPEYYFLQTFESDPEYPRAFAKMRDCRTTFLETAMKNLNINHGVFIDIFPLDFYPESKIRAEETEIKKKIIDLKIEDALFFEVPLKHSAIGQIFRIIAKIRYKNVKTAVKKQNSLIQSVPKSELVCNYCGAWGRKEIVPAQWLSETIQIEFEGKKYSAPKCYHDYLTHLYGNYMELPPMEKRISHHYTDVIDLDAPYTQYI